MAGERREPEPDHQLRRTLRPATLALDLLDALQKAAEIDHSAREFRAERVDRPTYAEPRRECRVGQFRDSPRMAAAACRARSRIPTRGDGGHHLAAREVGAQPFARLEGGSVDQRLAVAPFSAPQPGERALAAVDRDGPPLAADGDHGCRAILMLNGDVAFGEHPADHQAAGPR